MVAEMGQGKWGPDFQMRVNSMVSLALREWDRGWVSFERGLWRRPRLEVLSREGLVLPELLLPRLPPVL